MGSDESSSNDNENIIDSATNALSSFNKCVYQIADDMHATKTHIDQIRDNASLWAHAKQYAESQGGSSYDKAMNFSKYCYDNDPNKKYE